jgi:aryl-alcohol dehydrogenase-like predicted oxidoreductase
MQTFDWDGKQTPRLGFGCGSVMGRVGRDDSLRAMAAAWDAGITLFDTARSYGYGEAEGLLGEFLSGRREQAIVVTKFGILPSRPVAWKRWAKPAVRAALNVMPQARGLVRKSIASEASAGHFDVKTLRASLDESLRHLRTNYVDVLLAHEAPASIMAQEDLIAALQNIVKEGKTRRVGVSATGKVAATFALTGPSFFSVLQYPASGIGDWPVGVADERLRMANHPFGGPTLAKKTAQLFSKLKKDERVDESLREKLQGDPTERVAEFWFAIAMQQSRPHVIVPSMLNTVHLRANIAAIDSTVFTAEDTTAIEHWITGLRLRS